MSSSKVDLVNLEMAIMLVEMLVSKNTEAKLPSSLPAYITIPLLNATVTTGKLCFWLEVRPNRQSHC